mgnify:CR=1 FL=1
MTDDEREAIATETTPPVTWQDAALAILETVADLQKELDQLRKKHDALADVVLAQDEEKGLL